MNESNMELKNSNEPSPDVTKNKKIVRVLRLTNATLVILLIVFISSMGYKLIFLYQQNKWQNNKGTETAQSLSAAIQTLKTSNQKLEAKLEQQQLIIQDIQQNNAEIRALSQKANLVPLIETYHLARTANLLLITEGDINTARNLLSDAIKNINGITSFTLLTQKLTLNLQSLDNSYAVNKENLINEIDYLIRTLDTLPQFPQSLATLQVNQLKSVPNNEISANISLWQRFTNNIAKSTQNIIVIQHKKPEIPKLLQDQELSNLKQNIQFKLINAEWAVIHGQPSLFKSSIADVKLWFNNYYSSTLPENKNITKTLQDLEKANISTNKLDITSTVDAINSVLMQEIHGPIQK